MGNRVGCCNSGRGTGIQMLRRLLARLLPETGFLISVLLISGAVLSTGSALASVQNGPDPIPVEELERWGQFRGEQKWSIPPAAICGLLNGGYAVILIDGTLELRRSGESFFDSVQRFSLKISGQPTCLLQLAENRFLVGTDRGQLLSCNVNSETSPMEWAPPSGGWKPVALAHRSSNSQVLLVDQLQGQIWELDSEKGNPLQSWTGFIDPTDVTEAGTSIYVTDRGWQRLIPCVDGEKSGRFEEALGDHGAAPGLLAGPGGCAAISGRWIFVSDTDNHRVQIFGTHGIALHHWGLHALQPRESSGRLHYPSGLVFDDKSRMVIVLEVSESRVQYFGARDAESRPDPAELWARVDLISHYGKHWALDRGPEGFLLAVLEPDSERVVVLDRRSETPVEIDDVGGHGSRAALFRTPSGIDFLNRSGFQRFVVADRGNRRLQMFEVRRRPEARVIRESWITALVRSVDLGDLANTIPEWKSQAPLRPGALACLDSGTIGLIDESSARVLLLNDRFQPLGILGVSGSLERPVAIAADGDGFLIAGAGARQILRWGLDGSSKQIDLSAVSQQPDGKMEAIPAGVARHPDGTVIWTDALKGRLFRTDSSGRTVQILGSKSPEEGSGTRTGERELFNPGSLQIAGDGSMWVVDFGNHRGVVIEKNGNVRHFGSGSYLPAAESEPKPESEQGGES